MRGSFWIVAGLLVFSAETYARPLCAQIHQKRQVHSYRGAQFLHEIDSRLHTTEVVQKSAAKAVGDRANGLKPKEKIDLTLGRFSALIDRARGSVLATATLKKIIFDSYVIKDESFAQRYFDFRLEVLRQNEVHATMTSERRQSIIRLDQEIQKQSLDSWIDYLISSDSSQYPMWMKFWFFQGVSKLSKFDSSKGRFGKRAKDTVAAFPELNKEALELVSSWILKRFEKRESGKIGKEEQKNLDQVVESTSFGELYSIAYKQTISLSSQNKSSEINGRWQKFSRGSDPIKLVRAIEKCNGDWCIRQIPTARDYLQKGDMYIYFQPDQNRQLTVPVLAIRLEGGLIREVRGTSESQNIDLNSVSPQVVTQKIRELGFEKTAFEKMALQAIRFEEIYQKHQQGQALSVADLRFLYHFDGVPGHFGTKADRRRQAILDERDTRVDILTVLEGRYRSEEVALSFDEFSRGETKVYVGPLKVNTSHRELMKSLEIVVGDFKFVGEFDGGLLNFPKLIVGKFWLPDVKHLDGVRLPEVIMEDFIMTSLTDGRSLILPKDIRGEIKLNLLQQAHDLVIPSEAAGVHFQNLGQVRSLDFPAHFRGDVHLPSLRSYEKLTLPRELNGSLIMDGLVSAIGVLFPQKLVGSLSLRGLLSSDGLILPWDLRGGFLHLDGLKSASGLRLPEGFKMSLSLDGVETAAGLDLPRILHGGLSLGGLTSTQGIRLPDRIQGPLYLRRLKSIDGLILPQGILGELNLRSLETAIGLVLPDGLSAKVNLLGLTSIDGLQLPANFNGTLMVNDKFISQTMLETIRR